MFRALFRAGFAALLALTGCTCGTGLEVGGETPYVRCLAADPPALEALAPGSPAFEADGRRLAVKGLARPIRVAVFSGPALGPAPSEAELTRLADAKPDLALLLGGLGDDDALAAATAHALGGLPCPTLLVAGGRDTRARIAGALGKLPPERRRVVDVSAFESVVLGADVLVPVAGSFDGRYALDAAACGHGLDDLKHLAGALGAPGDGERRWLVSWEAPGGGGPLAVARTDTGVDTGNVDLGELADRVRAGGGLFAWPAVQAVRARAGGGTRAVALGEAAEDLRMVVPRLSGPALERADGSFVPPGFAIVRFDADGLVVESLVEWGASGSPP